MGYIKGNDRNQITFLPDCIDDLVSYDNPVRVIDIFVNQLDMTQLGFTKAVPAETGRPPYDPRDMLKLYIYGYFNQIRSSRKLMIECRRNIELFFLLNRLAPDFRTIADFRKENSQGIRNIFLEFIKLCLKKNYYEKELLAVDGSKFFASNSRKKMYNKQILKKKLERINSHLSSYLKELNEIDESDDKSEKIQERKKVLQSKQKLLKERKQLYKKYQKELKTNNETQLLTTDPDARMMKAKDGFHCAYNVQTAVSEKSHFIIDYRVTNHMNDEQLLYDFSSQVKETLGADIISVVADKGYDSKKELEHCILSGIVPYVGFKNDKDERIFMLEHKFSEITEEKINSTDINDIQDCLQSGVLPSCYEDTNISVEVKEINHIGCFHRESSEDLTVTCPMGNTLRKIKDKRNGAEYACRTACRKCLNRCTASKNHRVVYFGPNTRYVAARMYGQEEPLLKPPIGFVPNNSFFKKDIKDRIVILKVKDDIPKQKQRLCISEHPFGTVKRHHGAYYVLCRGIKKVTAELGLSFLVYNLKRLINMKGVKQLIEEIS